MDDYKLLIDLHKQGHRQGPGGDAETEKALNLAIVDRTAPPAEQREIDLYETYKAYIGYGVYVAKKTE